MQDEALREGSLVEFVGDDLEDSYIYAGHPGLVIDAALADEYAVSFVNGPSWCIDRSSVARITAPPT